MTQDGHIIQTVSDYVNWTETTAIYPRESRQAAHDYEYLGVYSEIGEVCGMFKREIRDPDYTLERLTLKLELGDIAWYLARLHYDHNKEDGGLWEVLGEIGVEKPTSCNCFSVSYAVWKHFRILCHNDAAVIKSILGISYETTPNLNDALAKVEQTTESMSPADAGKAKLIMELGADYKKPIGLFMSDFIDEVSSSMGLVKYFILCDRYRFDPIDVMRANYRKLEDRKERGKLHGQGDAR